MVGKKCHQHNATKFHGYDHCNDTMGRNWIWFSFGPSIGVLSVILNLLVLQGVGPNTAWFAHQPFLSIIRFIQAKFAIITPALITGAFAERIRFGLSIHGSIHHINLYPYVI
jgi:ammonia channel protein AmtB